MIILTSCIKISTESVPIHIENIYGCYVSMNNEETVCVNSDSTYYYEYLNTENVKCVEHGNWEYIESHQYKFMNKYFIVWSENELWLRSGDSIIIERDSIPVLTAELHRFYVCYKHVYFGDVILTHGYEGDPDGAPKLKWLEKSE